MSRSRRHAPAPAARIPQTVEESLVLALFDLVNHLQRRGEELASLAGLTTQQWLVLLQIAGDPNFPAVARTSDAPVLASDIARVRGLSRATVSAVVSALKQRGLISEQPDPDDARRRGLVITDAGVAALERVEPARRAANQRLLVEIDPASRKRMLTYTLDCLAVLWDVHEDERVAAARVKLGRRR